MATLARQSRFRRVMRREWMVRGRDGRVAHMVVEVPWYGLKWWTSACGLEAGMVAWRHAPEPPRMECPRCKGLEGRR